jgi:hypothetical protein
MYCNFIIPPVLPCVSIGNHLHWDWDDLIIVPLQQVPVLCFDLFLSDAEKGS